MLQKVIPRHQSSIRGERFITSAQMKLPACGQEFEIQISFTQWVNQIFDRFRLQTPQPYALAPLILNPNCRLEDETTRCDDFFHFDKHFSVNRPCRFHSARRRCRL